MRSHWPLTSCDLFCRYLWTGLTLGFPYQLDPTTLKKALQSLLKAHSTLAGRVNQDSDGRYGIVEGDDVELVVKANQSLRLADVPRMYIKHNVSDRTPDNTLLPQLLKQMQVEQLLAGKQAMISFQLTQLQDGCVLGVSLSHMLADGENASDCQSSRKAVQLHHASMCQPWSTRIEDAEGLGVVLLDLSAVYLGQPLPNRQQTRLPVQHFIASASGNLPASPTPSDEEIKATIPALEQPPASFQACIDLGAYEILSMPASKRATATHHSVLLLHIPDKCLDRLRTDIMQSRPFKQAGTAVISKHDISCALAWMLREAANGNDPGQGLQKNMTNIVGMRGNGCTELRPVPYFGNAVSSVNITAADVRALQNAGDKHKLQGTLAAAACAIRLATEAFRADPNTAAKATMALVSSLVSVESWQEVIAHPELNPTRDNSLSVTSWRNMYDKVDFGQGGPAIILGSGMPDNQFCVFTEGLYGDGVLCSMSFREGTFDKMQNSGVLQLLAPEATFV